MMLPLQQHLPMLFNMAMSASTSAAALLQTLTRSQSSMPGFNGIWPQWTGPGRPGLLWACMRHGEGLHSQRMHAAQPRSARCTAGASLWACMCHAPSSTCVLHSRGPFWVRMRPGESRVAVHWAAASCLVAQGSQPAPELSRLGLQLRCTALGSITQPAPAVPTHCKLHSVNLLPAAQVQQQ